MCGLIGRNGAGKTTLLRGLMGAVAASGKAELDGVDLIGLPSHRRLAQGIGYPMFNFFPDLSPPK